MPFQKGGNGNPDGRRAEPKPWFDAIRIVASTVDRKGQTKLLKLAEKTFEMALDGNMEAVKEIANRTDGKAVQQVNLDATLTMTGEIEAILVRRRARAEEA